MCSWTAPFVSLFQTELITLYCHSTKEAMFQFRTNENLIPQESITVEQPAVSDRSKKDQLVSESKAANQNNNNNTRSSRGR